MRLRQERLKGVDYSRQGEVIWVSDDIPPQQIIYFVQDLFGKTVYYSVEADRYIKDSRESKLWQRYTLNYLRKIPVILKDPSVVIRDAEDLTGCTEIYYKEIYVLEKKRKVLFALVVKVLKEKIVYNFHPQESGKVKYRFYQPLPEILYLKPGLKRGKYFRR